ncbi:hypothetical protein IFM89_023493, partial [Coptis chinensis]
LSDDSEPVLVDNTEERVTGASITEIVDVAPTQKEANLGSIEVVAAETVEKIVESIAIDEPYEAVVNNNSVAHSLALPTHVEKNALGFRQVEGLSTAANGEAFFDAVAEELIETGLARVTTTATVEEKNVASSLMAAHDTPVAILLGSPSRVIRFGNHAENDNAISSTSLSEQEGDANTPSFPTKNIALLEAECLLNSPIWADQTEEEKWQEGGQKKRRGQPLYGRASKKQCEKSDQELNGLLVVAIWRDNWLGSASLKDALNLTNHELKDCNSKVSTLIVNGSVQIPSNFQALITTTGLTTDGILKWNDGDRDTLIWCPDLKGKFSVASAFQEIRRKINVNSWHKHMWNSHTHPRTAAIAWRICQRGISTDEANQKKGVKLVSITDFVEIMKKQILTLYGNAPSHYGYGAARTKV